MVDTLGNLLETFDYYPFGLLMPQRNTAGANTLEKFTGKERDIEAGVNLDYFGARYYAPALGRCSSVDPMADKYPSWSPYYYAKNNPLYYTDSNDQNPICGDKNNCDDVYQEGAVVENNRGRWEYMGNNEWKDLEYNQTQSAESLNMVFTSYLDWQEHSRITQFDKSNQNIAGRLRNSIDSSPFPLNLIGSAAYDLADDAYISFLSLQRGNSRTNLAGEVVTGSRITASGVKSLVSLFPYSKLLRVPGLNAAQFSQTFKGTFISRLQPATRGVVNRKFNEYLHTRQNDIFIKGFIF